MKKLYLILAILLVAGFVSIQFLSGPYFGNRIADLARRVGSTLVFKSEPRFSLFPPCFSFEGVSWQGDLDRLQARFTAAGGSVRPDIISFLLGRPVLEEVELSQPDLVLSRKAGRSPAGKGAQLPEIGRLVLRDGAFRYGSIQLSGLRLTANHPGQETDLQCDFILDLGQRQIGNAAIKAKLHYYAPNLTFREGSCAFTATDSAFAPVQAQFSGSFEIGDAEPGIALQASVPEIKWHGIAFEDISFKISGQQGEYSLQDLACDLAGGKVAGNAQARLSDDSFRMNLKGEKIQLGAILSEAGLSGFKDGGTNFRLDLSARGTDQNQILSSLTGAGRFEGRDMRLEPFGELAMLLPLLGRAAKFAPEALDRLELDFSAKDGLIRLDPLKLRGPGISGTGNAQISAPEGNLDAKIEIRAGAMAIPVIIGGTLAHPEWRIGPKEGI